MFISRTSCECGKRWNAISLLNRLVGTVMNIKVGDVCKVNGTLHEVIAITPHSEIEGAVYYDLGDGYVERDVRFHPEAVYNRAEIIELAQQHLTQQGMPETQDIKD